MKKIINEKGFKKAMEEGKTWITLDCDLTETKNGRWYWEIEKSVFADGDGSWEALAHGTDDDDLAVVGQIWDNLIKKYSPDEYFVDQHSYEDLA
jgi:hypothetical protein